MLDLLATIKPRTVLEIGVGQGGTFFHWCDLVGLQGLVIGVDRNPKTVERAIENCGSEVLKIGRIVIGDTRDPGTFLRVKAILGERAVDFLFIDGDHSYIGVKSDYQRFAELVRPGGLIAFHDIATPPITRNPYQKGTWCGVSRFWKELRNENKIEFIDRKARLRFGIGVITKNAD